MSNTVTISKKEYRNLLKAKELINRLEGAGVDNWEGWSIARSDEYYGGISYFVFCDSVDEDYKDE